MGLRFATLDVQSFWHDEVFTVRLMHKSFFGMLAGIRRTESTPPLYYVLAWLWTRVFGTGEVGLRSLSAVFGVATVPAAFAAGRELVSRRAGIVAAALAAASPYLVWYSQEGRSYALYALLATLSVLLFARALHEPSGRRIAWWAGVSVLAIATHYFAGFLVLGEAAWLLAATAPERRAALLRGCAAIGLVVVALAPLAIVQRNTGHTEWVEGSSLAGRLGSTFKRFVTGEYGTPVNALAALAWLLLAVGVWLLVRRANEGERRGAIIAGSLGAATIALPFLLALVGFDYFYDNYLIGAWVPLALVVAAGYAATRARVLGPIVATILVGLFVGFTISDSADPSLRRDDFRQAARILGPARFPRAIVSTRLGSQPLGLYLGDLRVFPVAGTVIQEIDVLDSHRFGQSRAPAHPPPPGFMLVAHREGATFRLFRYLAPRPLFVGSQALAIESFGQPAFIYVERPRP